MKLSLKNSTTHVAQATGEETDWLYAFLSFDDVKAEQRKRAGYHVRDTKVYLYDRRNLCFPTGLLPIVRSGAKRRGFAVVIADGRGTEPEISRLAALGQPPFSMTGKWAFQVDALVAWSHGGLPTLVEKPLPFRGIVKSPTGSGKGRIAVAAAYALDGHTLFMVHRGHLARDVQTRWNDLAGQLGEPSAGYIGEGEWSTGERLTCATLQTLHRARGTSRYSDLVEKTTALVVDEVHTSPAESFNATIQDFTAARARLGLSGTPYDRGDRRSLVAVASVGPMVYSIDARKLIDAGVLSEPRVIVVPCHQEAPSAVRGDWGAVYQALVVDSAHRNGLLLACMSKVLSDGDTPGMVFVRRVSHAHDLVRLAEKRGMNVAYVDGSKNSQQRQDTLRRLEEGRLDFIVATKVFTEGVNIPELRAVINGAGGKSVIEVLQQVGRGTRTTATKSSFVVYEVGDKGEPMLHKHAKARVAACKREGYHCEVNTTIWPETINKGGLATLRA